MGAPRPSTPSDLPLPHLTPPETSRRSERRQTSDCVGHQPYGQRLNRIKSDELPLMVQRVLCY